ncbi:hypothetical protein D0868_05650 [Hortaea werneckii]|uniref:Cytochrome b n=2 Tax=Hortaea werneckii TaxID=91943 RepID=A0A3M6YVL4_HORWE|nr:hypothetical protein D0868_05650 [Hortaea werneckii]RMY36249.1 hypothetical protein D0866_04061 [Hortaea werneckii]
MINTLLTLKHCFSLFLFSIPTYRKRIVLWIIQSTKNIGMNYRNCNIYFNDGYSFLRICITLWSNVIMRFFALHFVLPFVLAALALMHLIALHDSAGSGNPLGVSGNYDRLPFAPYFIFKDLITIFLFIIVLSVFVFFMPNVLGDSENYVMANPMQTPPAIVPE